MMKNGIKFLQFMVLIINLGLKSIRFIIFNDNGDQIYSDSQLVNTKIFHEHVEQDAKEWRKQNMISF